MTTKSIHEFDDLIGRLGIEVNKLGCVMLPVEPFDLFGDGREHLLDVEDLYVSEDPSKGWVNGDVSYNAHITLLYGLYLPTLEQWEREVAYREVLFAWNRPEYLIPERITFFPSTDKNEPGYAAIVVEVEDPHLNEAHARLSYLPHVNTFPEYRPHMTLCYVKLEAAQKWMDVLNEANFHIYVKEGDLNYGGEGF